MAKRGWSWEEEEPRAAPHGSEEKTVTVTISSGNFKYETLETVGSESPIAGPATARSKFKVGETVYLHYKVRNDGDIADTPKIKVTDSDTGTDVASYTGSSTDPGWKYEVFKATVGTMPNKTWNLKCALTP